MKTKQGQGQPTPQLDLYYSEESKDFVVLAESIEAQNALAVDANYSEEIETLRSCLNCLYAMGGQSAWLFNAPQIAIQNQATQVLFSTLHKNLIALHASLKLTRTGLYGPARAILRHAFEALLVAKFCAISDDTTVLNKWKDGDIIYLTNSVLKRIQSPDTKAFSEFWDLLSSYVHATIYAQQIHLNVMAAPDEVPLNLIYLRILVECQYHLVNSHLITPSLKYYIKRYNRNGYRLAEIQAEMQQLLTLEGRTLLELPRTIVKNYRAAWKLST